MITRIHGFRIKVKRLSKAEVEAYDKEDFPYPNPSGEPAEAGVYFWEVDEEGKMDGAPIGPFDSLKLALEEADHYLSRWP